MAELSTLGRVIKTAYEGERNTNGFTDQVKAKLSGMSGLGTSGQWSDVHGKPAFIGAGASEEEARQVIGALDASLLGAANGIAPLDGSGKVPVEQLNIVGTAYKGVWDASTNTPAIANEIGRAH